MSQHDYTLFSHRSGIARTMPTCCTLLPAHCWESFRDEGTARTICVACLSTTGLSHLDSSFLNRMHRGAADVVYCHFKLHASFHKYNNIFLVGRVIIKTYKELEVPAKRTFPFSVYCKTDLPNYRKKSECCTAELKTFRSISDRLVSHSPS